MSKRSETERLRMELRACRQDKNAEIAYLHDVVVQLRRELEICKRLRALYLSEMEKAQSRGNERRRRQ